MDIDRFISKIKNLKESPTNNIGDGNIGTYDKFLFPPTIDDLSQDYQTPGQSGQARWRFSNVYPVLPTLLVGASFRSRTLEITLSISIRLNATLTSNNRLL